MADDRRRWSIRVDARLGDAAEIVAEMRGQTINEFVTEEIGRVVSEARKEPGFREQVEKRAEAMRALLDE